MILLLPDSHKPSADAILDILKEAKCVAVVGMSSKRLRPSHEVSQYLLTAGYKIVPVNPNETEVHGLKSYRSLDEVPESVDIVDVFRKAEDVPPAAESAIRKGAWVLWLQQGIVNQEAAEKARAAGLIVVMDACMAVEHRKRRSQLVA